MKFELESDDKKIELVVEISESERLRFRTMVTVKMASIEIWSWD